MRSAACLGEQDLTHLFPDEFNTVAFPALPPNVVTALSAPGNACMLKLACNVSAGSGEYLLDNLSFR